LELAFGYKCHPVLGENRLVRPPAFPSNLDGGTIEPTLRMLNVDLDSGAIEPEERGPEYWERYIGGRGVGAKLLSEEDFRLDPYKPRIPVFFCNSTFESTFAYSSRTYNLSLYSLDSYLFCMSQLTFVGY